MISIRASKLTSDSPSYSEKEKTDSGFTYRYDEKHLKQRWDLKKKQLKLLSQNIEKLRTKYEKDLGSDDLMTRAVAAVVGLIDDSAVRVGNEDSVKNADTYGATTLKVKHVSFKGKKAVFDFIGKDQVKQHITTDNPKVVSVLKELVKGKKDNDFIFEIDGAKIWDRRINRYLIPFKISAKDLRGFKANQLMKEKLKTLDFDEALEEVAEIVGHKASTLKNQYLDPDLVSKYKKAFLSIRALLTTEEAKWLDENTLLKDVKPVQSLEPSNHLPSDKNAPKNPTSAPRKADGVKTNDLIDDVWGQLQDHLPSSVHISSGIRSFEDQVRVINDYWKQSGAAASYPEIRDPAQRASILKQLGYTIASPKTTPHASGRVFDLSGGNLWQISKKIQNLMETGEISAQLKIIVEPKNNAVHLEILRASTTALSKIAAEEMEAEELHDAFKHSKPTSEIADEFEGAFGFEQHVEDLNDEEAGKFEREKGDPKWDEVLIDGEKKWTRKELRNYYVKNADKILKSIDGRPVMLYLGTGKNKKILKRNHNNKTIHINNREELEYWADRRLISIHLVMGHKTNFGWVDLDRHDYPFDKTLTYAKKLVPQLKDLGKVELWHSGGTGIHIELHLKKEWNIDTLRDDLKTLLDEFNGGQEGVSTGLVKGSGLRSDISTLHEKGNLRVEWTVGENYWQPKNSNFNEQEGANSEPTPSDEKNETATYNELYKNLTEEKATEFATNKPAAFLFGDDLIAKLYPQLKPVAVENLARKEPNAFLLSHFQDDPKFKEMARKAVLNVISSNPKLFFTMGLFEDPKFSDLVRGAVFAVVHKDPKFFLTTLLPLENFKPYAHLKEVAENSLRHLSKRAAKKQSAGIFIRVPSPLNKEFPKIKQDTSPTHITALYIGNLSKKDAKIVEKTLKEFIKIQKPFKVKFAEKVSYFKPTEHSDGLKVAKIAIESEELHNLNRDLKKALKAEGVEIDDHFPTYKPHITLGYIDPEIKYEDKIPKGGFKVEHVELWNGTSRKKFKFKQISKRATLQAFPKTCACGNHTWNSYEEFFAQPFKNRHESITPNAHRVQCMAELEDEGELPYDFVWGDCECGSSLVVKIPCLHQQEAKDPLAAYHKKRDFETTSEPEGQAEKGENKHRFVIQDHQADKAGRHFDLRLENDEGTMSSWAVKKHKLPSKGEKLLAVKTEDHPIKYMEFGKNKTETIDAGYGKGSVKAHDYGVYDLIEWKRDTIKFKLKGKETGAYTLHKMNDNHWILMRGGE